MKNLQTFEEFLNESIENETLNEDASLAISLMMLAQATVVLAVQMKRVDMLPDVDITGWWDKWKKDRRVNKILNKLNADAEVQKFLELPAKEQEGKWQKLIDTKLDREDKDLLKAISRDRVKRGKI